MKPSRLAVLLFLLPIACAPAPAPKPPVFEQPDGARPATCESACENMRTRECELGKPTPRGATCEKVCTNVWENNAGAGFPVVCLTGARTCEEAKACR